MGVVQRLPQELLHRGEEREDPLLNDDLQEVGKEGRLRSRDDGAEDPLQLVCVPDLQELLALFPRPGGSPSEEKVEEEGDSLGVVNQLEERRGEILRREGPEEGKPSGVEGEQIGLHEKGAVFGESLFVPLEEGLPLLGPPEDSYQEEEVGVLFKRGGVLSQGFNLLGTLQGGLEGDQIEGIDGGVPTVRTALLNLFQKEGEEELRLFLRPVLLQELFDQLSGKGVGLGESLAECGNLPLRPGALNERCRDGGLLAALLAQ